MTDLLREKKLWLAANWKALLVIVILGLLPFLGFLASPGKALYASDQLASPAWKFYFDALRHGTIPLWEPYILGGMPTFDAGFGDAGYPIFILLGLVLPMKTFISWCFIFHVLIAGLCAYYLVNRFFKVEGILAVALSAAYMFNTNFISHIHAGHTGKFYIMAWLPLALYLLLRSLREDSRIYHPVAFSFSIGLMLLPFHPQFLYYVLMGFFLVWAFKTFWVLKARRPGAAAFLAGKFWIPVFAGIGLGFFLLYPPMQWTKEFGIRGSGEKTTYEHATSWSMHPEETASLVVPEFTGLNERYWGRNPFKLNSEYPGIAVLYLGILGLCLFRREKQGWLWLWAGIGLLSILFGLGAHTPLFRIFYAFIPGIKNFRAPSMMLFWLATALLIMSAHTLGRLTDPSRPISEERRKTWSRRVRNVGLGIAGLLILIGLFPGVTFSIWDMIFGGEGITNLPNRAAAQSGFALGAIRAGVLLAILVHFSRKWMIETTDAFRFGAVLLVVTCVDLFWVNSNFIRTYDPDQFFPREAAVDYLQSDSSAFRIFGLPGAYERGVMQYFGIETLDGWTDNEYRLYREFRGGDYAQNPNFMAGLKQNPDGSVSGSNVLDMLNAKYLAYRMRGDGALRLARNTSALPRAWFAGAWQTLPDSQALPKMLDSGFSPRRLAYVSPTTPMPEGFGPDGGNPETALLAHPEAAELDSSAMASPSRNSETVAPDPYTAVVGELEHSYNRLVYQADTKSPGILVVSELYFPHWHATVDGKEAPLLRTDFGLRGIALKPGSHRVEMAYSSPWIRKGFSVAGLSLLVLIFSAAGMRFAPRSKSPHEA